MDNKETKIGVLLLIGFILFMGLGFIKMFKLSTAENNIKEINTNIEMPRPQSITNSDFDLSDREVEKKLVNPYEGKNQDNKNAPKEDKKDKKVAEEKKKDKTKKSKKGKPQVEVNIVDQTNDRGLSDRIENESTPQIYQYVNPRAQINNDSANIDNQKNTKQNAQVVKEQVLTQPTEANLRQLISDFYQNKIDADTFYSIIEDLLRRNDPQVQERALKAISAVPTYKSFVIVVDTEDRLPDSLKQIAEAFLATFGQASKLNILKLALTSKDILVVGKAIHVLGTALTAHSVQPSATGGNTGRGGRNNDTSTTLANYQQFIPVLQQLAQSSDHEIAAQANSLLSQIAQVAMI